MKRIAIIILAIVIMAINTISVFAFDGDYRESPLGTGTKKLIIVPTVYKAKNEALNPSYKCYQTIYYNSNATYLDIVGNNTVARIIPNDSYSITNAWYDNIKTNQTDTSNWLSSTAYAGGLNLTVSNITYEEDSVKDNNWVLQPYEIIYSDLPVRKDGITVYTPAPKDVSTNEFLDIVSPNEGFKTSGKQVIYRISGRIKGADATTKITLLDGVTLLSEYDKIQNVKDYNYSKVIEGEYVKVSLDLVVTYKTDYVGTNGIKVKLSDEANTHYLMATRNIELIPFTDSNADGKDDVTNEDPYTSPIIPPSTLDNGAPNKDNYTDDILGNLKFFVDTIMYYIKLPFNYISDILSELVDSIKTSFTWVAAFSNSVGNVIGFLPTDIIRLLTIIFTCSILTFILALFRR